MKESFCLLSAGPGSLSKGSSGRAKQTYRCCDNNSVHTLKGYQVYSSYILAFFSVISARELRNLQNQPDQAGMMVNNLLCIAFLDMYVHKSLVKKRKNSLSKKLFFYYD